MYLMEGTGEDPGYVGRIATHPLAWDHFATLQVGFEFMAGYRKVCAS